MKMNGAVLTADAAWSSGLLSVGMTTEVDLVVTSGDGSSSSTTKLDFTRAAAPTPAPTSAPTTTPTSTPTTVPTGTPSSAPTGTPSSAPTSTPTLSADASLSSLSVSEGTMAAFDA